MCYPPEVKYDSHKTRHSMDLVELTRYIHTEVLKRCRNAFSHIYFYITLKMLILLPFVESPFLFSLPFSL